MNESIDKKINNQNYMFFTLGASQFQEQIIQIKHNGVKECQIVGQTSLLLPSVSRGFAPGTIESKHSQRYWRDLNSEPQEHKTRPQLFKGWIKLSTGYISIQWIKTQLVFLILIHWIVTYPVDSAILRLNNRLQNYYRSAKQPPSKQKVCLLELALFLTKLPAKTQPFDSDFHHYTWVLMGTDVFRCAPAEDEILF